MTVLAGSFFWRSSAVLVSMKSGAVGYISVSQQCPPSSSVGVLLASFALEGDSDKVILCPLSFFV